MAEALLRTQGPGEEYRAAEARLLEPTGDQERGLLHLQARAALLRRRPEVAVDLAERLCRMDPEGEPLLAVAYRLAGRLEDSVRLATGAVLAGSLRARAAQRQGLLRELDLQQAFGGLQAADTLQEALALSRARCDFVAEARYCAQAL